MKSAFLNLLKSAALALIFVSIADVNVYAKGDVPCDKEDSDFNDSDDFNGDDDFNDDISTGDEADGDFNDDDGYSEEEVDRKPRRQKAVKVVWEPRIF